MRVSLLSIAFYMSYLRKAEGIHPIPVQLRVLSAGLVKCSVLVDEIGGKLCSGKRPGFKNEVRNENF